MNVPDNPLCNHPHILAIAAVCGLGEALLVLGVQGAYQLSRDALDLPDVVELGDFVEDGPNVPATNVVSDDFGRLIGVGQQLPRLIA